MPDSVGVRELRQNLSRYLRRVRRGERMIVTERNRPVAVLAPLPENEDPLARLIGEGKVTAGEGSVLDAQPVGLDAPYAGSRGLDEVRGDR